MEITNDDINSKDVWSESHIDTFKWHLFAEGNRHIIFQVHEIAITSTKHDVLLKVLKIKTTSNQSTTISSKSLFQLESKYIENSTKKWLTNKYTSPYRPICLSQATLNNLYECLCLSNRHDIKLSHVASIEKNLTRLHKTQHDGNCNYTDSNINIALDSFNYTDGEKSPGRVKTISFELKLKCGFKSVSPFIASYVPSPVLSSLATPGPVVDDRCVKLSHGRFHLLQLSKLYDVIHNHKDPRWGPLTSLSQYDPLDLFAVPQALASLTSSYTFSTTTRDTPTQDTITASTSTVCTYNNSNDNDNDRVELDNLKKSTQYMRRALYCLLKNPQNNLKVVCNGRHVYGWGIEASADSYRTQHSHSHSHSHMHSHTYAADDNSSTTVVSMASERGSASASTSGSSGDADSQQFLEELFASFLYNTATDCSESVDGHLRDRQQQQQQATEAMVDALILVLQSEDLLYRLLLLQTLDVLDVEGVEAVYTRLVQLLQKDYHATSSDNGTISSVVAAAEEKALMMVQSRMQSTALDPDSLHATLHSIMRYRLDHNSSVSSSNTSSNNNNNSNKNNNNNNINTSDCNNGTSIDSMAKSLTDSVSSQPSLIRSDTSTLPKTTTDTPTVTATVTQSRHLSLLLELTELSILPDPHMTESERVSRSDMVYSRWLPQLEVGDCVFLLHCFLVALGAKDVSVLVTFERHSHSHIDSHCCGRVMLSDMHSDNCNEKKSPNDETVRNNYAMNSVTGDTALIEASLPAYSFPCGCSEGSAPFGIESTDKHAHLQYETADRNNHWSMTRSMSDSSNGTITSTSTHVLGRLLQPTGALSLQYSAVAIDIGPKPVSKLTEKIEQESEICRKAVCLLKLIS